MQWEKRDVYAKKGEKIEYDNQIVCKLKAVEEPLNQTGI